MELCKKWKAIGSIYLQRPRLGQPCLPYDYGIHHPFAHHVSGILSVISERVSHPYPIPMQSALRLQNGLVSVAMTFIFFHSQRLI